MRIPGPFEQQIERILERDESLSGVRQAADVRVHPLRLAPIRAPNLLLARTRRDAQQFVWITPLHVFHPSPCSTLAPLETVARLACHVMIGRDTVIYLLTTVAVDLPMMKEQRYASASGSLISRNDAAYRATRAPNCSA